MAGMTREISSIYSLSTGQGAGERPPLRADSTIPHYESTLLSLFARALAPTSDDA
jgi:hypothetical protein